MTEYHPFKIMKLPPQKEKNFMRYVEVGPLELNIFYLLKTMRKDTRRVVELQSPPFPKRGV